MTLAYYIGMMHHTDPKKYPEAPERLWKEKGEGGGDWNIDDWKTFAMNVAENADEHKD